MRLKHPGAVEVENNAALRVALQAAFGSDPFRELNSIARIILGIDCPPTLFFEKAVNRTIVERVRDVVFRSR